MTQALTSLPVAGPSTAGASTPGLEDALSVCLVQASNWELTGGQHDRLEEVAVPPRRVRRHRLRLFLLHLLNSRRRSFVFARSVFSVACVCAAILAAEYLILR